MCVHVGLRVVVGLVRVLEVDCLLDWRLVLPTPAHLHVHQANSSECLGAAARLNGC